MTLSMGIPSRMANAVHRMFGGLNVPRQRVVDAVINECQRLPLADMYGAMTSPAAIAVAAVQAARECFLVCERLKTDEGIMAGIAEVCARRGVAVPVAKQSYGFIGRAIDKGWWRRALRRELIRRFEHTSIQLGLTHVRADPYVSRETCMAQAAQNYANQKMLESVTATNENGDVYSLAELAALGMGNKTLRRGELMLRIRGFEEVANKLGHVGMFWTITCPSKYHSVGVTNEKYQAFGSPTPRDAQAYLVKVWSAMRSALHRLKIQPYGFRIAEPHTDGCPHWHMLLFVAPTQQADMERIINAYALAEDGDEDGAAKNRV
ncbi:MAG: replication endonuclease, partial [Janthinobacterium lividum]|nr:replication endonuclease [Janthinobacterium lividum]